MSGTVEDRYTAALWYAWGRIDSKEYGDLLEIVDDGFAFAHEQKQLAFEFVTEQRTHLPNILTGWGEYVERKKAERDAAHREKFDDTAEAAEQVSEVSA